MLAAARAALLSPGTWLYLLLAATALFLTVALTSAAANVRVARSFGEITVLQQLSGTGLKTAYGPDDGRSARLLTITFDPEAGAPRSQELNVDLGQAAQVKPEIVDVARRDADAMGTGAREIQRAGPGPERR